MPKWQRAVCLVAILAFAASWVTNCVLSIRRGNEMIAVNDRLQAVWERRRQIESPGIDDSSRLRAEMAHRDIDREEQQIYAERSLTNERYVIGQSLLGSVTAMCLFAVVLALAVGWRKRKV
jgi:hypothetical protein